MLSIFKTKNNTLRLGLCLSKHSLAVVLVDSSQQCQPVIKQSFYYNFSSGDADVKSNLGECKDKLNQFIEKKGLKNSDCYAVLSKEDYQLLLVEPPDVPEAELLDAMRWKVKDLTNIDADNSVINIFPQPGKKMLYTVISERPTIANLIEFVDSVGLSLVTIDIEELSYRNYFDFIASDADSSAGIATENSLYHERGIAVVSLGENEGKLLIIKGGNVFLSRRFSINYGAGAFDELPEDEIILELQRSLDYYERQMRQSAPAEIVFFGAVDQGKITPLINESFQQTIRCVDLTGLLNGQVMDMSIEDTLLVSGAALRRGAA